MRKLSRIFIFQEFPRLDLFSRTIHNLENQEKIQDSPGV